MSETFLDKSTIISQFKEYYGKKILELMENPKYQDLNIDNYVDRETEYFLSNLDTIISNSYTFDSFIEIFEYNTVFEKIKN